MKERVKVQSDGYCRGFDDGQTSGRPFAEPGWWYCAPPWFRRDYVRGWWAGVAAYGRDNGA